MIGIVLGSGLAAIAEAVVAEREVAFAEIGLPVSSVPGHSPRFVFGKLKQVPVCLMMGRVHLYEGHSPSTVTSGVRWMASQGVRRFILTNAAGSLNPLFAPGSWMMLTDHLNLTGTSPLQGPDFVDLSSAYDPAWRAAFLAAAADLQPPLASGVYAGLRGPHYETPAECRMLRALGADAVGMSTVLETIQARALGLPVAAFSWLSNWAAGISPTPLCHDHVLQAGQDAANQMVGWLNKVLSMENQPSPIGNQTV